MEVTTTSLSQGELSFMDQRISPLFEIAKSSEPVTLIATSKAK